jgi:hypothetical protein
MQSSLAAFNSRAAARVNGLAGRNAGQRASKSVV